MIDAVIISWILGIGNILGLLGLNFIPSKKVRIGFGVILIVFNLVMILFLI